jgi:predicted alpha/beta hydrolase family esterase
MIAPKKIIILPGNGCKDAFKSNFYGWLHSRLLADGVSSNVILPKQMPDYHAAKESVWVPYLHSLVGDDASNTIVIGHSSGAQCVMRYLEDHLLFSAVLVSACWTDLGVESERKAGYYNR